MPADLPPAEPVVDPSPASPTRQPLCRWLRYSLRSLLVVMLLCGLAAAWVGREIQKGRDKIAAIVWVEAQGGVVYFDEQAEPLWQQRRLGAWYPDPVTHIDLGECTIETIAPLASLTHLRALKLNETQVSSLAPLESLGALCFVDLTDTPVTQEQIDAFLADGRQLLLYKRPSRLRDSGPSHLSIDPPGMTFHFYETDEVWKFTPPAPINPRRRLVSWSLEGDLALVLYQNDAFACDLRQREIVWHYHAEGFPRRLTGDQDLLIVDEVRPGEQPNTYSHQVLGLSVATGEQVFQWSPPRALGGFGDVVRYCFAAEGYFVLGGERSYGPDRHYCYLLDGRGQLLQEFEEAGLQILPRGEDFLLQTSERVLCLTPAGEVEWEIPFGCDHWMPAADFLELPDGDLVLYGYSRDADFGVDLLRLNPATGERRWRHSCADQGWGGSVEGYEQQVVLGIKDDRLILACIGSYDTYVEELQLDNGQQLHRWEFPHRW